MCLLELCDRGNVGTLELKCREKRESIWCGGFMVVRIPHRTPSLPM